MFADRTRLVGGAVGAFALLAVAGCSGEDSSSATSTSSRAGGAPIRGGAARVAVTLTQGSGGEECRLDHTTAAAGP
ncbi:hypothetical protein, partial [Nostocoides japonicum]|uniref:hypothetical protein n=1 Tax=Nostocoides japonicum TaxID=99481 RepID=UPI00065B4B58